MNAVEHSLLHASRSRVRMRLAVIGAGESLTMAS